MAHFDERLLKDLEEQVRRSDPRFAQALGSGRPRRPREYRTGPAWLVLSASSAMLVAGMVLPNGLLIAAAFVVAGVAGHLFDPHRGHASGRPNRRLTGFGFLPGARYSAPAGPSPPDRTDRAHA
ncbi:DUF3040 domain-containing protein [Streptomyces tuirus]|uniref:DUF3040 domain-containing protein n=1 Tax=Streptomyces tuirus TaxID=68278 RepID=A0A941FA87_9ACTN|nr:DUF3040 domain-containing protein [Streptomyces tuirus]